MKKYTIADSNFDLSLAAGDLGVGQYYCKEELVKALNDKIEANEAKKAVKNEVDEANSVTIDLRDATAALTETELIIFMTLLEKVTYYGVIFEGTKEFAKLLGVKLDKGKIIKF